MKGGLGTASLRLGDVAIGALAVVNAAGDIVDWRTGRIVSVAGALAAEVVAEAIVRGVRAARSVEGWPAAADLG